MPTWESDWKKAKKQFETSTGRKKPNVTVFGLFSRHASGLESLLKTTTQAYLPAQAFVTRTDIGAFRKTVTAFVKGAGDYVKVLDAAIKKEEADAVYGAAGKLLQKELLAIGDSMQSEIDSLDSDRHDLDLLAVETTNLIKSVRASAALCLAAAAKVKAAPTKAAFDAEIEGPARELCQRLDEIPKLRKAKGHTMHAVRIAFFDKYVPATAKAHSDQVRPYSTEGLKGMLPENAAKAAVLAELKKFATVVKAAADFAK